MLVGKPKNVRCVYDPLVELMAYYAEKKVEEREERIKEVKAIEERLKRRIIDGDKIGLATDLDEAMKKHKPLDIVNNILLDGMKDVGDLFGSGQMQLPFVLQSAEVMKAAVSYLEPFMEHVEGTQKGTMVIATVKGDVHDIGKNLVDIILANNSYKVVNLGIKCPIEVMLKSAEEHKADAVGMSGLLVKSTVVMKENLEVMNEQGITLPVIVGGAALTRRYVEEELRNTYKGQVLYASDAFDGLHLMQKIVSDRISPAVGLDVITEEEETLTGQEAKIVVAMKTSALMEVSEQRAEAGSIPVDEVSVRSKVRQNVPIPVPPFYGTKIEEDISLEEIFRCINEVALFRGQWQFRMSEVEYKRLVEEKAQQIFENLKSKVKDERLLVPKVVYGYFPCQSHGDDLIIYEPKGETNLHGIWNTLSPNVRSTLSPDNVPQNLEEWLRFTFPRQPSGERLCISDFFASKESGQIDTVAFQLVTVGKRASEYSKQLFESNRYTEYLYFHGLSVETAEALAEYWHKHVRQELGIADQDAKEIRRLFAQGYQGARYSFGYPACPDLEDQVTLFELLKPQRIDVELTEHYQLVPEQLTSAIIVHHPEAKYFNIR